MSQHSVSSLEAAVDTVILDGAEAEKILTNPLWPRLFAEIQGRLLSDIVAVTPDDIESLVEIKCKLAAVGEIRRALIAKLERTKSKQSQSDIVPLKDVRQRKRVQ